jgi:hypothetical protein
MPHSAHRDGTVHFMNQERKRTRKEVKTMSRFMAFIIFWLGAMCISGDTIHGTYSYTYGDSESLIDAKQTCKDLAVRDAIESYYIFVESSTEVENAMLKDDLIHTLSAGYLKNLTVIDQAEEGRTLTTTVEAEVDPVEVEALVKKIAETPQPADTLEAGSAVPETPETLESLLRRSENRMNDIEAAWNRKDFRRAYDQVQEMQKALEAHVHKGASPFEKALYLCVHRRTLLIKHAIGLEQAESQGRRKVYTRSEAKQVIQDAVLLKSAMNRVESIKIEDNSQNMLRSAWLNRCQATIDRVRHGNSKYKTRK